MQKGMQKIHNGVIKRRNGGTFASKHGSNLGDSDDDRCYADNRHAEFHRRRLNSHRRYQLCVRHCRSRTLPAEHGRHVRNRNGGSNGNVQFNRGFVRLRSKRSDWSEREAQRVVRSDELGHVSQSSRYRDGLDVHLSRRRRFLSTCSRRGLHTSRRFSCNSGESSRESSREFHRHTDGIDRLCFRSRNRSQRSDWRRDIVSWIDLNSIYRFDGESADRTRSGVSNPRLVLSDLLASTRAGNVIALRPRIAGGRFPT